MKLHLPRLLAAAVMAACVSAPAFAEVTTDEVTYENLTNLVYSHKDNGAIVLSDDVRLNIYNITDGKAGYPSDVRFLSNKSQNSGAIHAGDVVMFNNGGIAFVDNENKSGGGAAIYACNSVALSDNTHDIIFEDNIGHGSGGAIYAGNGVYIDRNEGNISFQGNKGGLLGGAIYAYSAGVTFTENKGNILFSNNTGSSEGTAIYAYSGVTISDNTGSVTFTNHEASSNGGTIYSQSNDVTISGNGAVSFSKSTAGGRGGAIFADGITERGDGNVVMDGNTSVSFSDNSSGVFYGGAIYAFGNIKLLNNKSDGTPDMLSGVYFTNNTSNSTTDGDREGHGGALYSHSGYVKLEGNDNVVFDSNKAGHYAGGTLRYSHGGGIYAVKEVSLVDNGDISFKGNEAGYGSGGAIYTNANLTIDENGSVNFTGNKALCGNGGALYSTGAVSLTDNGDVTFDTNISDTGSGGAIYTTSAVSLTGNGDVTFNTNTANAGSGGAIYTTSAVSLTGNGDVTFNTNTSNTGSGGAIYTTSTVTLTGNGAIKFNNNTATDGLGGAIRGAENITITDNTGNIEFTGNTAGTNGGAISNNVAGGSFHHTYTKISGNTGDISFTGNKAGGDGGAIHLGAYGTVEMNDNKGAITFSDNTAGGIGGAIYCQKSYNTAGQSTVSIANNTGDVKFLNNRAGSKAGAIQVSATTGYTGLNIRNNGNVLFEKNAVVDSSGNYLLRSIGGHDVQNNGAISLSAAAGKTIEFRDSIDGYFNLELNETYNGVAQTGDIVFTGAYTEQHLKELLQADGVNRQATEAEINASRKFTTGEKITVHGGRLRVEDGVVLSTNSFQMKENAGATLLVKNATVQCIKPQETYKGDGNINITSGNTLQVEGPSEMEDIDLFTFTLPEAQVVAGSLNATVGAVLDTDTLTLHSGSTLVLDQSHIDLDGGCLTLNMLGEDKINLVLTLDGMLTEDSIVNLFSDIGTLKLGSDLQYTGTDTFEFNASQYFTGSMIGEDTMVQFQNGSMTVTGLVTPMVPEPTTATLSLLALAALAARRRRK